MNLTGLTETRRQDDTTLKAIATTTAAKYAWLAPAMLDRLAAGKPLDQSEYEAQTGSGDDTVLARSTPILAMFVRWAQTALDT